MKQQLADQLQQMQTLMKEMQLQYAAAPQPTYQYYGGRGIYGGNKKYRVRGGRGAQSRVNWQGGCGGRA